MGTATAVRGARPLVLLGLAALAAVLAFAVLASPASAARGFACEITGSPSGGPNECKPDGNEQPGEPFQYNAGLEVDTAGNVWITEYYEGFARARLRKFDRDGEFLGQSTGEGTWGAAAPALYDLSWSDSDNQLNVFEWYAEIGAWGFKPDVTPSGKNLKNATEGVPGWCCGVYGDVDNSGGPHDGDVYVGGIPGALTRSNPDDTPDPFEHSAEYITGNRIITVPPQEVWGPGVVEVSPLNGDVYAVEGTKIHRFKETGEFVETIEGPWVESPDALAFDPTTGNLAITDRYPEKIYERTPAGTILPPITPSTAGMPGGVFGTVDGLAIDSEGRMFILTTSRVIVLEPSIQKPRISYEGVTGSTATGTTVKGEINPLSGPEVTKCELQYGTTKAYTETPVPCSPAPTYAAPQKVTAAISGLTPEQAYHYRFSVTTANGVKNGGDRTFTPHHVVDTATEAASAVGPATATLNGSWTGAGENVDYQFEWGPTKAYGNETTLENKTATGKTTVSAVLKGLEPQQRYHFRLVATNAGGTSFGRDLIFDTASDRKWICELTGEDEEHEFGGECQPRTNRIPGGELGRVSGVVEDSDGNVWVMDEGKSRLVKFDPNGNYLAQNTGEDTWEEETQFRNLAYGETEDQIYVMGYGTGTVWAVNADDASSAGVAVPPPAQWGHMDIAVDNSGGPHDGDIYTFYMNTWISRWHPDGTPSNFENFAPYVQEGNRIVTLPGDSGSFQPGSPFITSDGDLWFMEEKLWRLDETGAVKTSYEGIKGGEVVYEPVNDNIIAFDGSSTFYEYDLGLGLIRSFTKDNLGYPDGSAGFSEINVGPSGRMLSGGYGNNGRGKADIYSSGAPQPTITYHPETGPTRTQIEVHATVATNTEAGIDSCRIEYGETYQFELGTIPCSPMPDPSDFGPTDVNGTITGLDVETLYHYRFVITKDDFERRGDHRDVMLHAVTDLVTEPATDVTTTSANLNASFTANGPATEYFFEYGNTPGLGQKAPVPAADAPAGSGKVDLTTNIKELLPGSVYYFRVVASNADFGTSIGALEKFKTLSAPTVTAVSSSEVNDTDAKLNAIINPNGFETSYRFEYGTTPSYGLVAPIPDGVLPAVDTPQKVQVHIENLQSGSTYHFRLIAESAQGVTTTENQSFSFYPPGCPNAQVRQETGAAYLPDCRAYELVSPENAGGIMIGPAGPTSPYATNPPRLSYMGFLGVLPDTGNPPNVVGDLYVAERSPTGWSTKYAAIPADQKFLVSGPPGGSLFGGPGGMHTNRDMSEFLSWDNGVFPPLPEKYPGSMAPYVYDARGRFVERLPTNLFDVEDGESFIGDVKGSGDFSHFFFSSRNIAFDAVGLTAAPGSVYRNDRETGLVEVISNDPDGGPIQQDPAMPDASEYIRIPETSVDGSRALMSTAAPNGVHLYLWDEEDGTFDVSLGADGENHGVSPIGMTEDGAVVLFSSMEKLTDDDHDTSRDIFRWDIGSGEVTRVSTGSPGTGDTDECTSNWASGCDATPVEKGPGGGFFFSQNRSLDTNFGPLNGELYFYSPEQLDGVRGLRGERNVYTVVDGEVHHVTTLRSDRPIERIQVSPSNEVVSFLTKSQLTAYDNDDFSMMYQYDVAARQLKCLSCLPSGEQPTANVEASIQGLFMSHDGRTFFSTRDQLTDRDVNGLIDIYEFVEGRPQLISSGLAVYDSGQGGFFLPTLPIGLIGVTADGVDVYFSYFEGLVKQDRNGSFMRIYDARTGGGFPYSPPPPPCNAADECHGPDSSPPTQPEITSQANLGATGNLAPTKPKSKKKCKKKAGKKCRAARKGRKGKKRAGGGRRATR